VSKTFEKVYNNIVKFPTIKSVAEELGIHSRTVQKKAKALRDEGIKLKSRTASYKKEITTKHNQTIQSYRKPKKRIVVNSRVLVISDLHIPYHHKDAIKFLAAVKKKYNPDTILDIGDEQDLHCMSYHDTDPNLPSASDELEESRKYMKQLEKLFPEMDLIESNHGSLAYRKAKTHGFPKEMILPYNDLLQVGDGWRWHFDLTIELSNGQKCYFHHGKSSDVKRLSQNMGMNACQGHYHSSFGASYWGNPNGIFWGLQVGCLIDDKSYAMAYNKTTVDRPVIGCAIILNGQPHMIPLVMDENGDWDGIVH